MARTPEGIVKDKVKKLLDVYREPTMNSAGQVFRNGLYAHWPVQNGMGMPTLDCIVCYYGHYIAIETKAPGKHPTPRQQTTIKQMEDAGAIIFVIDGDEGVERLQRALDMIKWSQRGSQSAGNS